MVISAPTQPASFAELQHDTTGEGIGMPPRIRRVADAVAKSSTPKRSPRRSRTAEPAHRYLSGNALVCGDNLDILKELPDECVDLIYLDPPFNSNQNYVAAFGDKGRVEAQLRDIWRWTHESESAYQRLPHGKALDAINAVRLLSGDTSPMAAYALFMGRRLVELHRVLKPTGSLYLHCDPNANWLLRVLMDAVFGSSNLMNELVWHYRSFHGQVRRYYPKKHDCILFYRKTGKWTFNRQFGESNEDTIDFTRWNDYLVDGRKILGKNMPMQDSRFTRYYRRWVRENGREPRANDVVYEVKGQAVDTVWDIKPVDPKDKTERVGYPTQKPLVLLERIIKASSNEGDLVLDPFCGCGTAADAAAKLGRRYLGIDVSAIAVRVMEQRLASRGGKAMPVIYKMDWDDYDWEQFERRALMHGSDAEDGLDGWAWAEDKVAGLLNAVPNAKKQNDGGVDARYFTEANEVVPIQVKMHRGQIGTPDMQKLLGVQAEWQNRKVKAPMSLMVTLYPPSDNLRTYATKQGQVTLRGERYPRMQVLSVQEMLTKQARPKLPPVDPRYFVGDTQTRLAV